jgi:hypothetical protein
VGSTRYEASDADSRLIAALAAGVGAFLIAAPFILLLLYPSGRDALPRAADLPTPPAPLLQVDPDADLATLHAQETRDLTTYGWIDRKAGVARIPIDHAMELTAQRGIPGWERNAPAPQIPPRVPGPR